MIQSPDEINSMILEPIEAQIKSYIIFGINNNEENVAGGSHWSLCVYSKSDNTFFHFDSSGYTNQSTAKNLCEIIRKCFRIPSLEFKRVDCLQQNNCYDCGIYVLCHADIVCEAIIKSKSIAEVKKLSSAKVMTKRTELIEIIKSLSEVH